MFVINTKILRKCNVSTELWKLTSINFSWRIKGSFNQTIYDSKGFNGWGLGLEAVSLCANAYANQKSYEQQIEQNTIERQFEKKAEEFKREQDAAKKQRIGKELNQLINAYKENRKFAAFLSCFQLGSFCATGLMAYKCKMNEYHQLYDSENPFGRLFNPYAGLLSGVALECPRNLAPMDQNKIRHLSRHNVQRNDIADIVKLSNALRPNLHQNMSVYSDGVYEVRGVDSFWGDFEVGTAYPTGPNSVYNTSGSTFTASLLHGHMTGFVHNAAGKVLVNIIDPYDKSLAVKASNIDRNSVLWMGAGAVATYTCGPWVAPPLMLFGAMNGAYNGYQGCVMAEKAQMNSIEYGLECGLKFVEQNGYMLNIFDQLFRQYGMERVMQTIMDDKAYNVQHHMNVITNMENENNSDCSDNFRFDA